MSSVTWLKRKIFIYCLPNRENKIDTYIFILLWTVKLIGIYILIFLVDLVFHIMEYDLEIDIIQINTIGDLERIGLTNKNYTDHRGLNGRNVSKYRKS